MLSSSRSSVRLAAILTIFFGAASAAPPLPVDVAYTSIALPAAGAWSIDQPMLASLQFGIDALAVSAIVSEAMNPINDAGAGIPTLGGIALLVINRLVGAPLNGALAHYVPPGETHWSSRREPWVSMSLESSNSADAWLGLEGGYRHVRIGTGYGFDAGEGGNIIQDGLTSHQVTDEFQRVRGFVESSYPIHPRMRIAGGLQTTVGWGTQDTLHVIWTSPRSSWTTKSSTLYRGFTIEPNLSLEISQWSWLSLQARLGVPVMATRALGKEVRGPQVGLALKIRLPRGDAELARPNQVP